MRRGFLVVLALVLSSATWVGAKGPAGHRGFEPKVAQANAIEALPRVDRIQLDRRGIPSFLAGSLGTLTEASWDAAAARFISDNGQIFQLSGREEFETVATEEDALGMVHVRLQQTWNGLPVVGAEVMVHALRDGRDVYAVNGAVYRTDDLATSAVFDADKAIGLALDSVGISGTVLGEPEMVYVVGLDGEIHLAWSAEVTYESNEGPERDRVFADALDASMAAIHPQIFRAKYRRIYTANNGTSLPGSLLFNEGGSSSDQTAMGAYNNSGLTYDYYYQKFSRDSYNNSGATLTSTVHYSSNYNNAYWNGSQMVYGDGDGSTFTPFAKAFDVVAHELTHAVTDVTANLTYQKESGALNEAMSDIMASAAEAWADGGITSNTWKIGEDCYTPGTSGDALRYMDNPTIDGYSADYYPERLYPDPCTPNQNTNDLCGVHGNSGIANLAFVLLSQGGTHPRGKTSVNVPSLGISKAEQIFYRALTVYMTSSTNFQGARNATAQAAQDLYGSTDAAAVQSAWDAVGVPGGQVAITTLTKGVAKTNLSGSTGNEQYFKLSVPSGATNLTFQMSGGTGDADLYTRRGSLPTTSSYDCRPYLNGNSETCTVASPVAGDYFVMIRAYSTYSGVSLVGNYTTSTPNNPPTANFTFSTSGLTASFTDTSSDSDGSIASRSWNFGDGSTSSSTNPSHTYASGGTRTVTLTVTDNNGATDSVSKSVTVTAPANQAPTANFSFTTSNLVASFSDSSSDPDGSISSRSWNFGDGGTSSSTNPSHTYAAGGTYTVTLTVTDNGGLTDSISKAVTVTAGGGAPCTGCTEYTGSLSGSSDYDVQPNGTYYYSAAGAQKGWLEGPAGTDFDLYLYKWSGSRWSRVASSTSASSSESINYNGTSGYYYWRVTSYSGSGSYQLWLDTP